MRLVSCDVKTATQKQPMPDQDATRLLPVSITEAEHCIAIDKMHGVCKMLGVDDLLPADVLRPGPI